MRNKFHDSPRIDSLLLWGHTRTHGHD